MSKVIQTDTKAPSGLDYQIVRTVNGNLEFGLNIRSTVPISVQASSTHDLEFTLNHNLGFVPHGFLVLSKDATCDVYSSRISSWTTSQMFLKCTVASVNLVLVAI